MICAAVNEPEAAANPVVPQEQQPELCGSTTQPGNNPTVVRRKIGIYVLHRKTSHIQPGAYARAGDLNDIGASKMSELRFVSAEIQNYEDVVKFPEAVGCWRASML